MNNICTGEGFNHYPWTEAFSSVMGRMFERTPQESPFCFQRWVWIAGISVLVSVQMAFLNRSWVLELALQISGISPTSNSCHFLLTFHTL